MNRSARVSATFAWLAVCCAGPLFGQTPQPSAPLRRDRVATPVAETPTTTVRRAAQPVEHPAPMISPHQKARSRRPAVGTPPAALPIPVPPLPPEIPTAAPSTDAKGAPKLEKLPDPEKPEGAKLPRFASLRSDDVNMRAGPGTRYRIEWVYKRRELPVEIEREYDNWRWVRDADGIQGWVHQATLMGRRSFIVMKADATLRSEPNDTAAAAAVLKVGVIGRIRSCDAASAWCYVQAASHRGYLRREQFWGVLPGEAVSP